VRVHFSIDSSHGNDEGIVGMELLDAESNIWGIVHVLDFAENQIIIEYHYEARDIHGNIAISRIRRERIQSTYIEPDTTTPPITLHPAQLVIGTASLFIFGIIVIYEYMERIRH
jgi:hypothetical protein